MILAKTVKGYGMGESGEGQMIAHQAKKMTQDALKQFRDRFDIPMPDDKIDAMPFISLADGQPGAEVPAGAPRRARRLPAAAPAQVDVAARRRRWRRSSGCCKAPASARSRRRWRSCRCSARCVRDKAIGKHIVPIVPDESRTFGMEGMFRQLGIYSAVGQLYKPQDADQLMYYREDKAGQVLQEGINEAGAMSSWIAAATSYSTNDVPMIPFYIYYSMFGLQRVGDLAWAAGDMRARGFLLGGTAGRTTLNGEGPAARGRPQPRAGVDDSELHFIRSDVRVRGRRHRPRRHPPDVRGAGGRLLLHHADERELPASRRCPRVPRKASSRGCTCCRKGADGQEQGPARAADGHRARSCAK